MCYPTCYIYILVVIIILIIGVIGFIVDSKNKNKKGKIEQNNSVNTTSTQPMANNQQESEISTLNNQMQGINLIVGSPFIYSASPPQTSPPSTSKKKPKQNIQYTQIPVGPNNITYPVIPMIYPQQGIYSNQPIVFSNGFIPNQQSQIIYYQVIDGKMTPLPQVNFVPINQAPIAIVKNMNNNNEKMMTNENKNENFNKNTIQYANAIPVQVMQMQSINQNTNNFK